MLSSVVLWVGAKKQLRTTATEGGSQSAQDTMMTHEHPLCPTGTDAKAQQPMLSIREIKVTPAALLERNWDDTVCAQNVWLTATL